MLPHLQRATLNGRVFAFNTALCLLILHLQYCPARAGVEDGFARHVARRGDSKGSTRLFFIQSASQAAFAFLLLVGWGLMIRSLIRLQQVDHGFHPDNVLTMRVPIGNSTQPRPSGKYDSKPRQMAFYRQLVERLDSRSFRASASAPSSVLLNEEAAVPTQVAARTISPQYLSVMGIPLIAGRFFTESDQDGSKRVVIVNERLAQEMFPHRDAVGQKLPGWDIETTIVGVVKNASQTSYEQPAEGELYHPYQQYIFGVFPSPIVVRTSGDPLSLADTLRKEIWAADLNQPIVEVETMNDVIADSIWRPRVSAWIFSVLGSLALLLASAGVYGEAYTKARRAREVGIRVALGATPRRVVGLILHDTMIPLAAGLASGLVAALLLSRVLTSLLYEISSTDPVTYLGAGALLLAIEAAASARPAWKAAIGDPRGALRTE